MCIGVASCTWAWSVSGNSQVFCPLQFILTFEEWTFVLPAAINCHSSSAAVSSWTFSDYVQKTLFWPSFYYYLKILQLLYTAFLIHFSESFQSVHRNATGFHMIDLCTFALLNWSNITILGSIMWVFWIKDYVVGKEA